MSAARGPRRTAATPACAGATIARGAGGAIFVVSEAAAINAGASNQWSIGLDPLALASASAHE